MAFLLGMMEAIVGWQLGLLWVLPFWFLFLFVILLARRMVSSEPVEVRMLKSENVRFVLTLGLIATWSQPARLPWW